LSRRGRSNLIFTLFFWQNNLSSNDAYPNLTLLPYSPFEIR
jgi:hypothetical protein